MTGIPISEIYDTAIRFTLNGMTSEPTFPVASLELERIQHILDASSNDEAEKREFIVFDTLNGWTVAVRLAMIEMVHVRLNPIHHNIEHEPAPSSMLFCNFGDKREILSTSPPYPEEIAALAIELEDGLSTFPRHFVSLKNVDDEWLYIGVEHIRLVQISTDLITEGHKTIRKDMQSGEDTDAIDDIF